MSDTLIGVVLGGKYKITKRLGQGGMAEVYMAHQENLDRPVAIKLMHHFLVQEQDFLHRFKREARAMAAMNHPNIVGVYDFDVYGENTYYLVMEYIAGGTLKDRLKELAEAGKRMPLDRAMAIGQQVADALDYAHSRNMIHRDVKPANIMINDRGQAVLTDFGIVKLMGGQSMAYTATGALIGTPAYMSPEQALGKKGDARSDIYSLGVLLFQMVTGQLPFDADTPLGVVMKHVNDPIPAPETIIPNLPPAVQEIILKAMAKEPEVRYQTAGELATALRRASLSPPPETAVSPPVSETAPAKTPSAPTEVLDTPEPTPTVAPPAPEAKTEVAPESRRPRWLYGAGGLLAIALIAALLFGVFGGGNGDGTEGDGTAVPIAGSGATQTVPPTPSRTAEAETTGAPVAGETPDVVASAVAAIQLTEESENGETDTAATATPSSTPTPRSSATPTIDQTAVFLEDCRDGAELVDTFTYGNPRFGSAPTGSTFSVSWVLRNSGACPWPPDLNWTYQDGTEFGVTGPVPVDAPLTAGEMVTLTADLVAPNTVNTFESTWRLVEETGEGFADPLTFSIAVYAPATETPAPTATSAATATPEELPDVNYAFEVIGCEYIGSEWRCTVRLTPYGGAGGPYTLLVLDQPGGQATEFRGPGPHTYFAQARRCAAFNSEVRVIDDGSATEFSRHLYIDPDEYFEGGCTEP